MDGTPYGIVHGTDATLAYLPLEEVQIKVFLLDVSARVSLIQTFSNQAESPTSRAKYVFPVPSRAAVCAFEMEFEDGRTIIGISKEKTLAAEEHEKAISEGKASGLVECVTDDVFTISIGSIPARQTVSTKVVFVMDLLDDEFKNEVRLQLPMSVGSRYGTPPPSLSAAMSASSTTRLRITVDIQMSGVIRDVSCPTHRVTLSDFVTPMGQTSRRRKTAKIRSLSFLKHNFVLTVRADGLDAPRCFAERDPGPSGTIAMQLTMIPKIDLPPVPTQEYLFVVDRSGSMSLDNRIEIAKNALKLILHMLPQSRTLFNIFSFGDAPTSFWPRSEAYDQYTLDSASAHVKGMGADYGGTEICAALQQAFNQRNSRISTMVFVLTDGNVEDDIARDTIATVTRAVAISSTDAPLRVFALGIGDQVSTAVVEGIARAGNGESLFAVQSESIIGKCAKLIRAGRSSFVQNISIDWGVTGNSRKRSPSSVSFSNSNSFDQHSAPTRVQLSPPPNIQQTPAQISKIFPGLRFIVFALTTHTIVPKEIVLRGQLNGGEGEIEIEVPVSAVKSFDKRNPGIPLVHTLAARRLITDFLEHDSTLPTPVDPATPLEDVRKASIIRLGEDYQLASKFTSFVAVDGREDSLARGDFRGRSSSRRQSRNLDSGKEDGNQHIVERILTFALDSVSSTLTALTGILGGNSSGRHTTRFRRLPGAYPASPPDLDSTMDMDASGEELDKDSDDAGSFSTMSSLDGSLSNWSSSGSLGRFTTSPEDAARVRSPSPAVRIPPRTGGRYNVRSHTVSSPPGRPAVQPPVPTSVVDLIQLQCFDGCFSLSDFLGDIVGKSALQIPTDLHTDNATWATALAVAFLRKHLTEESQSDVLDGLLDKVMEFIEREEIARATFDDLVRHAMDLVA